MQWLEIILMFVLAGGWILRTFFRRWQPSLQRYLPGIAAVSFALHALVDGMRWQMIPAYVLLAMWTCLAAFDTLRQRRRDSEGRVMPKWAGRTGSACVLLLLLFAVALPNFMPVFELPPPRGPYAIGTTLLQFADTQRAETLTMEDNDHRQWMAQVWYPAAQGPKSTRANYLDNAPFWLRYWTRIPTHATRDAEMATDAPAWPIVLYSHCYMCPVNQSTVLMEALASHGYIVFSVAHPYEEVATVFPDGRAQYGDFKRMTAVRQQFPLSDFYQKMNATSDIREKETLLRDYLQAADLADATLRRWTQDTESVLDQLYLLQTTHSIFAGKLDLGRVAALGYSMGGAVAGQLTIQDARIKAGINIDCVAFGDMIDQPLNKPFLFLSSQAFAGVNEVHFFRAQAPVYSLVIAGTTHQNFSDMTLQAPFLQYLHVPAAFEKQVGMAGPVAGPINGDRARELTNVFVIAFLDRYLRDLPAPQLDATVSTFPEVLLRSKNIR